MSRNFWQLETVSFQFGELRIELLELTISEDDRAEPVMLAGKVLLEGNNLRARIDSQILKIQFSTALEFRATPEICSWPAYEDGEEIIAGLIYKKPGNFFYNKEEDESHQVFAGGIGWLNSKDLQCYIVHSESFDVYVISSQPPAIG